MEINIYQQCPCHTEKKIKFCCGKSVVSDLDGIMAKHAAGQTSSALDQIDRVIQKSGHRDCLVTIQTKMLIENGDLEKAQQCNDVFLKNNPEHHTGHLHRTMIALAQGDLNEAIEALQDTMDSIPGNSIPVAMAQPFRMVGLKLLRDQQVAAAFEYRRFAATLKPDRESDEMYHQVMRALPDVQDKMSLNLHAPREGVQWEKKYTNVIRAIRRGQYRKALKMLTKANAAFENVYEIRRSMAIVNVYLNRTSDAVEVLEHLMNDDTLESWKRVEAACLRNYLSGRCHSRINVVRHKFRIENADAVIHAAQESPRTRSMRAEMLAEDPFGESGPPVGGFVLLSKDPVDETGEELSVDDIPEVRGEFLVYAGEHGNEARLEYAKPKDSQYDAGLKILHDVLGDHLDPEPVVSNFEQIEQLRHESRFDWMPPEKISPQENRKLRLEKQWRVLRDRIANLKLAMLDGQSLRQAAGSPEMAVPVQACIVYLSQMDDGNRFSADMISRLCQEINFTMPSEVEVESADLDAMTPLIMGFVDPKSLEDQALVRMHERCLAVGNYAVLRKTNPELIARPSVHGFAPKRMLLTAQAQLEDDPEKGLEIFAQLRSEMRKTGEPAGLVLLDELEFRMALGMADRKLRDLIRTIQARHLEEEGVEARLRAVLERVGILAPGSTMKLSTVSFDSLGEFDSSEEASTNAGEPAQA